MNTTPPSASPDAYAHLPYRPCAGIMLLNRDGLAWIGRRVLIGDEATSAYRWQMPQGGIDEGEDPREGALRELEEEVGTRNAEIIGEMPGWLTYDIPPEIMARKRRNRWRGQKQKWFAMRFLGSDDEFELSRNPGDVDPEFDQWRWVEIDALPDLIIPFKRPIYEAVTKAFRPLAVPMRDGRGR
jgi:putative (di)nucleoside polyphosphate hydrolase